MPTSKRIRIWAYDPKLARKNQRGTLSPSLKAEVTQKANPLIEQLKPRYLKPVPKV